MAQVPDEYLATPIDRESDSIGQIVKHVSGNLRSRWTDLLTTDGEKPDRDRDGEFVSPPQTREELMQLWDAGWNAVLAALEALTNEDLGHVVTIRGEAHSVMQAINRNITHTAYHCGQIVMLGKYFTGDNWHALTMPRNAERTA